MNKIKVLLDILIILVFIESLANGSMVFIVGHPEIALYISMFFISIYIPSWAVKNRMFPCFYRPRLNIKVLIAASVGWLILSAIDAMLGRGYIRVDLLITLPVMLIISNSCLFKWFSGLLDVSHNKSLKS